MARASKGSSFERETCKRLSLWWTAGEDDDVFWRSQTSGARATTRKKQGKTTFGQDGDIAVTNPIGQPLLDFFSIELKRGYNKATFHDCLDAPTTMKQQPIADFVQQAMESTDNSTSRHWLLIHKRDRRVPMLYMSSQAFIDLMDGIPVKQRKLHKKHLVPCVARFPMIIDGCFSQVCCIPFDMFLDNFEREHFE